MKIKNTLKHLKGLGPAFKAVGYHLPKTIIRRAFTNANITDYFPDMRKKK